jgi:hypothetical protein
MLPVRVVRMRSVLVCTGESLRRGLGFYIIKSTRERNRENAE